MARRFADRTYPSISAADSTVCGNVAAPDSFSPTRQYYRRVQFRSNGPRVPNSALVHTGKAAVGADESLALQAWLSSTVFEGEFVDARGLVARSSMRRSEWSRQSSRPTSALYLLLEVVGIISSEVALSVTTTSSGVFKWD